MESQKAGCKKIVGDHTVVFQQENIIRLRGMKQQKSENELELIYYDVTAVFDWHVSMSKNGFRFPSVYSCALCIKP